MYLIYIVYIVILITLDSVSATNGLDTSCDLGARAPARDLYYCGSKVALTIQQSDRLQHKLLNAILAIIFTQKLGYNNITIVEEPTASDPLERLTEIIKSFYNGTTPCQLLGKSMVNIEVNRYIKYDLPTEIAKNWARSYDEGYTGTNSQYKWFLHLPSHSTNQPCPSAEYLEFYSSTDMSACFPNNTFLDIRNPFVQQYNKTIYSDHCIDKTCAIVFSTSEKETFFLIEHIKSVKLNFIVVWLEENIGYLYDFIQESNQIFFIVDNFDWPVCLTLKTPSYECFPRGSSKCPYEETPNTKLVWSYVNKKKIHDTVNRFKVNSSQINDLVKNYRLNASNNTEHSIEYSACSWLQNNTQFIEQVIPDTKTTFIIQLLYCETFYNHNAKKRLKKLVNFTTKLINNWDTLNSFLIHVNLNYYDCKVYDSAISLKIFNDKLLYDSREEVIGYVIPAIPEALDMISRLSKVYQMPVITFSANGPSFRRRDIYPNVFRIVIEKEQFMKAYLAFFQKHNWRRVAVISGFKQNKFPDKLQTYLTQHGFAFTWEKLSENGNDLINEKLMKLKNKQARIIIVDMEANEQQNKDFLCTAYKLGMTPRNDYVWVLPEWPYLYEDEADLSSEKCEATQIQEVIDGHFSFTIPSLGNEYSTYRELDEATEIRKQLEDQFNDRRKLNYDDAGFIVDAIRTIALGLRKLISEHRGAEDELRSGNPGTSNIIKLSQNINNSNFDGVSGKIQFYHGSINASYVQVKQWLRNNWTILDSVMINTGTDLFEVSEIHKPEWLTKTKEKPGDGTSECTFRDTTQEFLVECPDIWIKWTIVGITVAVLALLSTVITHRINKRNQKRKIHMLLTQAKNKNTQLINLLHSLEVSRENFKIIWEIGRGGFGIVYGGEWHLDDGTIKGVAIKTLNPIASTENDILMEANTMASFDHKNIVKLVAVCTLEKPIYIVMELMLKKDLKQFLLCRRHLVNEPDCVESQYISNKRLTQMALDLAMALSYLAKQNFVHRDIASRNCMVNANGVVKLGDFGMTRNIVDEGQYVCSRKGVIPVLWMAPESLVNGTYTSMSDVWSYGVVLYEIITFGGTPYPNMAKLAVWEYVVDGGKMFLPNGINSQLRSLMLQCWSYEASERPAAADIVVFLADRPEFLHPCLEENTDHIGKSFKPSDGTAETPVVRFNNTTGLSTGSEEMEDLLKRQRKDSGYVEAKRKRNTSSSDHDQSDSETVFITCTY